MKKVLLSILSLILLISCGNKSIASKDEAYLVTSNSPLKWIVENIAKDKKVVSVLKENQSHESFELSVEDMKQIDKADMYYIFDIFEYEEKIEDFVNNEDKVLNVLDGIDESLYIEDEHHNDGDHNKESHHHDHGNKGFDPHVWFSLEIDMNIAKKVLDSLVKIYPDKKDVYTKNYEKFVKELKEAKEKNDKELKDLGHLHYIIYHPALDYVTKGSEVHELALENDGKELSVKELSELIHLAKEENVKTIYVQPQFPTSSAEVITKELTDVKIVEFNLEKENVIDNINLFIKELK